MHTSSQIKRKKRRKNRRKNKEQGIETVKVSLPLNKTETIVQIFDLSLFKFDRFDLKLLQNLEIDIVRTSSQITKKEKEKNKKEKEKMKKKRQK